MSAEEKGLCRLLVHRVAVLGLVSLTPLTVSARVPYQSKPQNAGVPATQASNIPPAPATAAPSDPTSEPSAATDQNTETSADDLPIANRLASKPAADAAADGETCSPSATSSLPTLGTSVHWMPSPDEAVKVAEKEHKMVFLIQVSGNFAKEEFT
jgi:hypothetical protein